MKKFFLLLLLVLAFTACNDDSDDIIVEKQYTFIPDDKFEEILIEKGIDSEGLMNGRMLYSDAKKVIDLNIEIPYIYKVDDEYNLKGIEDFINLKSLSIKGGETDNIDLSSNKLLTDLKLNRTHVNENLIISENINLKNVYIEFINITDLTLSANTPLDSLTIYGSKLQSLAINNIKTLKYLDIDTGSDNFLDVDISNILNLEYFKLRSYHIPFLDISKLTKLREFDTKHNRKLTCIKIFENQDTTNYIYDYHTLFTTDCDNQPEREYTLIPNEELERLVDTERVIDGKVLTMVLERTTELKSGGRGFVELDSLDGVETLINLETISFSSLSKIKLEDYDFSQNPKLKRFVVIHYGSKQVINFLQLPKLEKLVLYGDFDNLDFSNSIELTDIYLADTGQSNFDFSNNTKLKNIEIQQNVHTIDISKCLDLQSLEMSSNVLQNINLTNHKELTKLDLSSPSINNLDLSNNLKLKELKLKNLHVNSLDLSNKQDLEWLRLDGINNLSELDLRSNINLKYLNVYDIHISNLNIENNRLLKSLWLKNTPIQNLDITKHIDLVYLTVENTNIENLDIKNNRLIESLRIQNSSFTNIDLSNQNNLLWLYASYNKINSLDISNNLLLEYIDVTNNPDLNCIKISEGQKIAAYNIDSHHSFSTSCN